MIDSKIDDLLEELHRTLKDSRTIMLKLKDVTSENNWELWTQWEETLMKMLNCIDNTRKVG